MNSKEIAKLNQNLETLNKNIEALLNKLSNPSIAMVAGPEVSQMLSSVKDIEQGMVIPLNGLVNSNLKMSVESGVSVVNVLDTHAESSCFNQIRYNPKTKELTVFFKGNRTQKAYTYRGVPQDLYRQFISAKSLGRFYANNIKGEYNFQ